MTDQGSEETPTTNVPTPPSSPPADPVPPAPDPTPTFQQPPAYQPPAFDAPPPPAYPPQPAYQQPPYQQPAYQQPAQPAWGQPPAAAGPAWGQPQQPPPTQPGWGAPQAPAGPAWGQPQQPPAPAWSQPQPQYWVQPGVAETGEKGNSVLAIIAGIPLLIYGLLITLGGAALLAVRSFVDDAIRQGGFDSSLAQSVRDAIVVVAVIILIVGILQILAAIGIWAHKGWGRWLGIIWGVLGTLIGLASLGGSRGTTTINGDTTSSSLGGALFILVPYGFVLIAMIIGGGHFHRRRR